MYYIYGCFIGMQLLPSLTTSCFSCLFSFIYFVFLFLFLKQLTRKLYTWFPFFSFSFFNKLLITVSKNYSISPGVRVLSLQDLRKWSCFQMFVICHLNLLFVSTCIIVILLLTCIIVILLKAGGTFNSKFCLVWELWFLSMKLTFVCLSHSEPYLSC